MRLSIVLPRNMHFAADKATSIDLCAYDYLKNSRFVETACVFHRPVEHAFSDVPTCAVPTPTFLLDRLVRRTGFETPLKAFDPDLILVEQHIPTAFRLAKYFPTKPVVVRRHGIFKKNKSDFHTWARRKTISKLAAVVSVSNAVDQSLLDATGNLEIPHDVVYNGINPDEWRPARQKQPLIVFAGRLDPEKGVSEAIIGTNMFLKENPDWNAKFVLSVSPMDGAYLKTVSEMAGKYPEQMELCLNQPVKEVQNSLSTASIALVPSKLDEAFGRTAIEAMACEAALICSATGGMAEVVTPQTAITLSQVTAEAIAEQISNLSKDETTMAKMAKAGRAHVMDCFDIRDKSSQFDDFLETIWQGRVGDMTGKP